MDSSTHLAQIVKVEQMDTSPVELNIEENIVTDDNNIEILAIHNDSHSIQLEYLDGIVKMGNELVVKTSVEEENKTLKKELTLIQEKFAVLHSQVQNQSKLIELLVRLDMLKSDDEPDQKELDDLHRKISLCYSLMNECTIKYNELCNEKRRVLLVPPTDTEKRAPIWEHFTVLANIDGQKSAECNYCGKNFNYKNLNANKCREHLSEKCDKAPEAVKATSKPRVDSGLNKSKFAVWNHFLSAERDGKTVIACLYCSIEYSSRNATKCREHLAFKCPKIPEEVKDQMRATFSQDYINNITSNKRSSIWEHFSIHIDDDKTSIQCIYCCMNYANKNATKCREHLMERCDKIPLNIRTKISNSLYESPIKTWTQIKIPIWKHFSVVNPNPDLDRKQYKCNYCRKLYSSKNVTKFRLHLLYKCEQITQSEKNSLNMEISRSSIKSSTHDESELYYEMDQIETQQLEHEDHELHATEEDEEKSMEEMSAEGAEIIDGQIESPSQEIVEQV